jgi:phosphoribosylamine--glycine ligase
MAETILLVGGGGREHAIARALADTDAALYACAENRNPGIAALAAGFETLDTTTPQAVVAYAEEVDATLAVIGPETPLEAGVADALADADVYPFGPTAEAARIETDKAYQRRFMREHEISGCPTFETFDDMGRACEYIDESEEDLVVKPAGLTGGKGVRVIGDQVTPKEAKEYLRESDYDRVVLEERLVGEEFTVQALVANGDVRATPAVQDHKRAYEGDEGPNTGGMGSYSDAALSLPFMTDEDYRAAVAIIEETVMALDDYTGVLYGQFMLTADGPRVVEFNARFGDPEAMNTLPVLETDLLDVLVAAREGESLPTLDFTPQATVCKYAVPAGYPDDPDAGAKVEIDAESADAALLFYASVDERDDGIYTTTSRAFAVVGVADTIETAEEIVDEAFAAAGTDGLRVRHDIGKPDLVASRVEHMNELRGASED